MKKLTVLSAALLLVSGCTLGPDYKRPQQDLPAGSSAADLNVFTQADWWHMFEDPVLDKLEDDALNYNQDLKAAIARVDQARAEAGIAKADQLPSISAGGSAGREGNNVGSGEKNAAQVSASFELDLWGKYRRLSEAAQAKLLASQDARDTVKLTLTADVANQYFTMRMLDQQIQIAQETLKAREENVRIYKSRFEHGLVNESDLRRVEANVSSVEAEERNLKLQLRQTETALAVLVGRSPRQMAEEQTPRGKRLDEFTLVPNVPADLPSDLLERRPDVHQAEENLIAANANIGAARAAYFPSISLTAAAGYASSALKDLFSGPAGIWNMAAGVATPIFEGGKIRSQNEKAEAIYQEQLAIYQKTIQTAFKEALDALAANEATRGIFDSYQDQTNSMRRSYEITQKQERSGLIGVTDLLSVEENLLSAEMNLSTARRNELSAVVNLAKALGGGWKE